MLLRPTFSNYRVYRFEEAAGQRERLNAALSAIISMSRAGIARRGGFPAKPAIILRGTIHFSGTQRFQRV